MAKKNVIPAVAEIAQKLSDKHATRQFPNFIDYLRFPHYRNLQENVRLDLSFPVTALVGPNGSGKTSLLHALYGCPGQSNVGNFWFSTELDPIIEGEGKPNCLIYGYYVKALDKTVEVLKTRVNKEGNPNYWEPSRPIKSYGMEILGAATPKEGPFRRLTRWKTLNKEVVYLDFRRTISAFDRYFWLGGSLDSKSLEERKSLIRRRSPHLVHALDEELQEVEYYGSQRIVVNRELTKEEIEAASFVLGRSYLSGDFIDHKFYPAQGPSLRLRKASSEYSDAFAGSGETAVFISIARVLSAEPGSLILLDEPEVSLHPGAQDRLLRFLMMQALNHDHQIVFTTHSPALVKDLPPEAIKVVHEAVDGRFAISPAGSVPAAFGVLEHVPATELVVMVEDELSAELIRAGLRVLNVIPGDAGAPRIQVVPGGSSTAVQHILPAHFVAGSRPFLLLDGDTKGKLDLSTPKEIAGMSLDEMLKLQEAVFGQTAALASDGGDDPEAKGKLETRTRDFLNYCYGRVGFFPGRTPEELIWVAAHPEDVGLPSKQYKSKLRDYAKEQLGKAPKEAVKSAEILVIQKQMLTRVLAENPPSWWAEVLLLCRAVIADAPLRPLVTFSNHEVGVKIGSQKKDAD